MLDMDMVIPFAATEYQCLSVSNKFLLLADGHKGVKNLPRVAMRCAVTNG